jgi:hypothetical protein
MKANYRIVVLQHEGDEYSGTAYQIDDVKKSVVASWVHDPEGDDMEDVGRVLNPREAYLLLASALPNIEESEIDSNPDDFHDLGGRGVEPK